MDRRTFLAAATSAGVLASAGCVEGLSDDSGARIDELEGQLDAKNATIDDLEDDLDEAEAERDEFEVRIANQSEEIDALEADLAAKQSTLDDKRAELETKRNDLDAAEGDIQTLETEVSALETDISELESTISDLEPEHNFSDAEIDAAVDVAHEIRDAVVRVHTSTGYATGYQIERGVFATVNHAFGNYRFPGYPRVETFTRSEYQVDNAAAESDIDLRVLEGTQSGSRTIDVHHEPDFTRRDVVVSIGHPMNVGDWVISVGRLDFIDHGNEPIERRYEFDMPIMFGNSGSPVFNLDGEFVGMSIAAIEGRETYDRPDDPFFSYGAYDPHGLAVPYDLIVDQLSSWGY